MSGRWERSNIVLTEKQIQQGVTRGLSNVYESRLRRPAGGTKQQRQWVLDGEKRKKVTELLGARPLASFGGVISALNQILSENSFINSVSYLTGRTFGNGGSEILFRLLQKIENIEGMDPRDKEQYLKTLFERP